MTLHRFVPTNYYNVIGTSPPALTIANGDSVITKTIDARGFDAEGVQRKHGPNPMNGPIHVEGAESGDALRVEIIEMMPTRDTGWIGNVVFAGVVDPGNRADAATAGDNDLDHRS